MRLILVALLLVGCAQRQLQTPQSGAVTGAISESNTAVAKAQTQQKTISQHNATIRSNLERADSKDALIKAWRVWKKEHP